MGWLNFLADVIVSRSVLHYFFKRRFLMVRVLFLLSLTFLISWGSVYSGEDRAFVQFPQLTLYDGEGSSLPFPTGCKQILFLGFQTRSKAELLLWYKAVRQEKKITAALQKTVIGVLPPWMSFRVTRDLVIATCRKAVPKEALPYFRIAFFDKNKLSSLLGLSSERGDFAHIQVLYVDGEGKIRWHASGSPTPELLAQLGRIVSDPAS